MKKSIYARKELISKAGITETQLSEWEKIKLLKPIGYTDDKVPFYTEYSIECAEYLLKFKQLGYGSGEIQTIIKKVGLPKSSANRGDNTRIDRYLTVGGLAEAVGVSPRTLKHWEDKGIIEPDMRSEGGFRLFSKMYIYLCTLIQDLQLFGYTLEQIKVISDYFRNFLAVQEKLESYPKEMIINKVEGMLNEIQLLHDKMNLLKQGIQRWEDLLKKKHKEIMVLRAQNQKRPNQSQGETYE